MVSIKLLLEKCAGLIFIYLVIKILYSSSMLFGHPPTDIIQQIQQTEFGKIKPC